VRRQKRFEPVAVFAGPLGILHVVDVAGALIAGDRNLAECGLRPRKAWIGLERAPEKGLGLGLSICDRIARLLRLQLGLRSTPGRGSVFSVRVPVGDEPSVEAVVVPAEAPVPEPSSLVGLTVLCIDNEPEILDGMNALLSRWGMKVLLAPDATTARRLAGSHEPSLVLADHRLGDANVDGLELLLELCPADEGAPSGALITADHSVAVAARARELGFRLLRKPLKPAALRALLGALASQRRSAST